mmetsp:Transcript_81109/g.99390  ORF Transcript_81109/g.99390 Transcript_81109/m.99390 type:complete len:100 (-) Transcript_81109:66-365(-)
MNHNAKTGIPALILYPSGGSPPIVTVEVLRFISYNNARIPPTPVICKELNKDCNVNTEWNARDYIEVMTEIEQQRGPQYKDDDPHLHKLYMVNDDNPKK